MLAFHCDLQTIESSIRGGIASLARWSKKSAMVLSLFMDVGVTPIREPTLFEMDKLDRVADLTTKVERRAKILGAGSVPRHFGFPLL
jgi:hypothetical protein